MATKYFSIAKPGIGNVGSFQVSGYPYVTGSTSIGAAQEHKIEFPRVAKSVTVINKATPDLKVHFNSTSSGNVYDGVHYITLATTEDSVTFNIKCKEIYISNSGSSVGSYELFAELTGIEPTQMPILTGSGLTE